MAIMDKTKQKILMEKHCENLREFSRNKLVSMNQENSNGKKRRRRQSMAELYASSATEIAELIIQSAKSYVKVEDMSNEVAIERALADYMFWYNGDPSKKRELESIVYNKMN
ncbi:UNVERIFIED_ORG: hypothetical protein J2X74_003190 [Bacillus sp. 1751]|nr:hypothetical protein [Bacillus sp. 1751]